MLWQHVLGQLPVQLVLDRLVRGGGDPAATSSGLPPKGAAIIAFGKTPDAVIAAPRRPVYPPSVSDGRVIYIARAKHR